MRIVVDGASLNEAGCHFCGACVEVCPTGSIREDETIAEKAIGKPRNDALVPCRAGCPAHSDISRYIRFIKEGNFPAASAVVREKSPFPRVLGAVCTHPCELECKRNAPNSPVSIRKRKARCDHRCGPGWYDGRALPRLERPAVTVFEKLPMPGGMMRYGIPPHRLSAETINCEMQDIFDMGVVQKSCVCIENAPDLLRQGFDAVYAAVGTHQGVVLPIKGKELDGVLINTDFLRLNAMGMLAKIGNRVIVVGGGNVAFDCASVARRLGAREIHLACLESYETMPSSKEERA
ncbi:MAG: 4Fe-4S binding protein [Clostridia bacterium]